MQPAVALSSHEVVLAGSAGLLMHRSPVDRRMHTEDDRSRDTDCRAAKERACVSAIDDLGMALLLACSVGERSG